jgi:hypothetical protein
MRRTFATVLVSLAAVTAGTPSYAVRDVCSGEVDRDCEYCSYNHGPDARPAARCDSGGYRYTWQACTVYAAGVCARNAAPVGRACAFNSVTDFSREAGWQVGDVNAGPLHTGAAGTLHCKIVADDITHDATDVRYDFAVTATADHVVVGASPVSYRATAADAISLCTSWDPVDGPTLYYVARSAPELSYWTTDPDAWCSEWGPSDPNYPYCGIWLAIDSRAGTNIAEVWQDCEPYYPII